MSFTLINRRFSGLLTVAISLSIVICTHSVSFAGGGAKQLRYNLLPGETLQYSTSANVKNTVGEMMFSMETGITANLETKVESIDDAKATLSVSYSNAKLTTSGMAMAGVADGTKNYDEFSNNNETLTLSERGEIIKRMLKSAKKSGKLSPIERNAQSIVKAMSYLFTEFPEKPIAVGDNWTIIRNDTVGNKNESHSINNTKIQYTLAGYTDTLGVACALLKCRSISSTLSGTMEMMGNSMSFEGDGSLNGKIYVEINTGMLLASSVNNQVDMRISMGGQDGMIMPVNVDMHTAINRITTPTK
jgi:hypothetical protein